MNKTRLKIELLCKGARTEENIDKGRKSGAGPTGGRFFTLPDGTCIEIPLRGKFVDNSPFRLVQQHGSWLVFKGEKPMASLKRVQLPLFYEKTTSDGTPMNKIALLHGKDCLASTVYSKCIHWLSGKQCKFCGIELLNPNRIVLKTPVQVCEVAQEAFKEGVATHITLTTGTPRSLDKGASLLAETTKAIKEQVEMPVHVQLEPPENARFLELLHNVGIDTIGLHVESFNQKVLSSVCPAKSNVQKHFKAWKNAVELFGECQVSTFLIAGLGESDESILLGAEETARMGVVPYLLPLRPTAGTFLEEARPPLPSRMIRLYRGVAEILHRVGLDPRKSKAGCVRCGACSALKEAFVSPP